MDTRTSRRGFLRALAATTAGGAVLGRAQALEAAFTGTLDSLDFRADDAGAVARLRDQYLLAPDLVYLNHASIGTVPRPVIQAHAGYLELCETHPSLYVWGDVWREVTERVRAQAAALVRSAPNDLAVTHNTTEAFNILAHGLPLGPGDEILFSSLNHAGASVAWDALAARRGFSVRRFEFPLQGLAERSADDVVRIHTDAILPETRVLVFPHVDNMVGLRHPVERIAAAAKARGVEFVLVDGAQSLGMIPVDLDGSAVDAYAASPHKWLQAPKGLGLFYISAELRPRVPRMWHKTSERGMDGSARDYEDYSTRAWPGVVALGDALAFQAALGAGERERRSAALWRHVKERVDASPTLTWRSPGSWEMGSLIMAVGVRGQNAPDLATRLLEHEGAVMRAFGGGLQALRVSPNLMTDENDLDRVLSALERRG